MANLKLARCLVAFLIVSLLLSLMTIGVFAGGDESEVESVEWVQLEDLDDFVASNVKPSLRKILPHIPALRFYIENYLYGDY